MQIPLIAMEQLIEKDIRHRGDCGVLPDGHLLTAGKVQLVRSLFMFSETTDRVEAFS
jgi:hypothetical protein